MTLKRVGIIGWRGMVGSVLLERMRAESDFEGLTTTFYSTSQVGQAGPENFDGRGASSTPLGDAYDLAALSQHDAIVTCQGGDYTKQILPQLRAQGGKGYWIDAASAHRTHCAERTLPSRRRPPTHTTHTFSHLHVCERAKFRTFAHPQRISAYEQGMGCKGACAVARVCERAKFILKNVCNVHVCVSFLCVRCTIQLLHTLWKKRPEKTIFYLN